MSAPSGTVTFLFTDIEGSTRMWQAEEVAMRASLSRHDELLRATVAEHQGVVFATMGDGMAAAFASASEAVRAAIAVQAALGAASWPTQSPVKVRMGVHTGEAEYRGGDYFGTAVNRTARLMAIGHGGQVLVSSTTAELLEDAKVDMVYLGDHRLRDLDRSMPVYQVGGATFASLRSVDAFPGNLPLQVSSFVGRDRELSQGALALRSSRLVTLTGVGGVGKTRLALQLAAETLPGYHDGAWVVELAATRDPDRLAETFTAVFGLVPRAGQSAGDLLVEFLAGKRLLLVVDNCEHLLDPVAALLERIQRSCPDVRVLATSREGLALDGEQLLAVPSLVSPGPDASLAEIAGAASVALFVERAQRLDAEFALTADNAAAVAQVCRRLDGIPLAIELAAARVRAMNPAELARALDHRFETLSGGRRGAVERHQTLRAAIDWSYDLLAEPERVLLGRLSVFAGGCTRQAAEAVCAGEPIPPSAVFGLLAGLVDRSLVVADRGGADTRYRLLETIREYAEEHAGAAEGDVLRAAYATYYAQSAEDDFVNAHGPDELQWTRRVSAEIENLTAAMNWAVDTDNADVALRIATHTRSTSRFTASAESVSVAPALRLRGAADHPLYPMALAAVAYEIALSGDRQEVKRRCDQAIEAERRAGSPSAGMVEVWVYAALASVEVARGSWAAAADYDDRGAELALAAGDFAMAARLLSGASATRYATEDDTRGIEAATRALALAREFAGPLTISDAVVVLAVFLADSDPTQARALQAEALATSEQFGNTSGSQLMNAVHLAVRLNDWQLAMQLTRRAIPSAAWTGDRIILQGAFIYGGAALAGSRPDVATRLLGAARTMRPAPSASQPPAGQAADVKATGHGMIADIHRDTVRQITAALPPDQIRQLRAESEAMDLKHAVAYALSQIDSALADPTIEWSLTYPGP